MGRYYNGDINGKFWFAVQPSDDADFFGVSGTQDYLNYFFDKEDLPKVTEGINKCKEALGEDEKKLNDFFKENTSYTNKEISENLMINSEKVDEMLKWYARLELGYKIEKCLIENGQCSFEAEI